MPIQNPASHPRTPSARQGGTQFIAVAMTALLASGGAFAQQDPEPSVQETIIVTGSNIRTSNFNSSSPLTSVDSADLDAVGARNVGDFLSQLPSVVGDATPSSNSVDVAQDTGLNTAALRNLGASRTLVLVNGRRFVSGISAGSGYGVDLNAIPTGIIERIDVLTGGQSAAYGSDAIAGVVNIITKTRFEGVELKGQYGLTSNGDLSKRDIELIAGHNFGEYGNAWIAFGYSGHDGLMASQRDYSSYSLSANDTDADGMRDTLQFIGSSHIPTGRIGGFKGDGSAFSRADYTPANSDAFNFHDYRASFVPVERSLAAAGLTYEFSDRLRLSLESNYAQVETAGRFEPIPLDTRNNIFELSRGGSTGMNIDPALGAVHPLFNGTPLQASLLGAGISNIDDVGLTFRRLVEFGTRGSDVRRETFRFAGALDYEVLDDLFLTVSATHGQTSAVQNDLGDINLERARFALDIEPDGAGGYQCRDTIARIDGCVPFNPFNGPDDPLGIAISPEAVRYLAAAVGQTGRVRQSVVNAILSGDLNLGLFALDQSSFALGAEYRQEAGTETPDGLRQKGIVRGFQLAPTDGSFTVLDVFAEIRLPISSFLTVDAAVRNGSYSSVGNATTWKIGFDAPVTDWVRFRGARSTAVRAPNVSDLYAGGSATTAQVTDPCNGTDASTTSNIATNCRSIAAIQSRINSTGSFTLTQVESQNTSGVEGGSASVKQETADSTTIGAIVTLDGYGGEIFAAVDYYNIRIDNAIARTNRTIILNRCFDVAPTAFDPTCGGLVRRDLRSGAALDVNSAANNENIIATDGVDLELAYSAEIGGIPGRFDLRMIANYLFNYSITGILTGDTQDLTGEVLYPKLRLNWDASYTLDKFLLSWRLRYWDSVTINKLATNLTPELNSISAQWYNDIRVSYRINDDYDLYLGVLNVFNVKPPIIGDNTNPAYFEKGSQSNGTAYDLEGLRVFGGVIARF